MMTGDFFLDIEAQAHQDLLKFYEPYFSDTIETEQFINMIYSYDYDNRKPRQMLYQVERFVSLATNIDKIKPARDGLRILFIKTCMEALFFLSKSTSKPLFFSELAKCFNEEGKAYILTHFQLTGFEQEINGVKYIEKYDLCIEDILQLIKAIRDKVVHEGIYWETQLFAYDKDSEWLSSIRTRERILSRYQYKEKNEEIEYSFCTTLQFDAFIHYFVSACIEFILRYVNKLDTKERADC